MSVFLSLSMWSVRLHKIWFYALNFCLIIYFASKGMTNYQRIRFAYTYNVTICLLSFNDKHFKCEALIHSTRPEKSKEMNVCFFYVEK